MKFIKTELDGVFILEPIVYEDNRGFFMESYSKKNFEEQGISYNFIQDNHSFTKNKNTLRGLHYQKSPHAQTTLIKVVSGSILDVAVDIRKGSPTYGKSIMITLSEENHKQLLLAKGFAHGFYTLSDNVNIIYKMDDIYMSDTDRNIRYDDKDLAIQWPKGITPLLSERDDKAPFFENADNNYVYGENC